MGVKRSGVADEYGFSKSLFSFLLTFGVDERSVR